MRVNQVAFKKVPKGASKEDRERMHKDWLAEFKQVNPGVFHSNGEKRSILNRFFGVRL